MKPQGRCDSLFSPQAAAAAETSHHPSPTGATLFHPDFELVPAAPSAPSALRSPAAAGRARFLKPAGPAPGPARCGSGALYRRPWLKAAREHSVNCVTTVRRTGHTRTVHPESAKHSMRPIFLMLLFTQTISTEPAFQSVSTRIPQNQGTLIYKCFYFSASTQVLPWQLLQIEQALLAHLPPKFNVSSSDESTVLQKNLWLLFPVTHCLLLVSNTSCPK